MFLEGFLGYKIQTYKKKTRTLVLIHTAGFCTFLQTRHCDTDGSARRFNAHIFLYFFVSYYFFLFFFCNDYFVIAHFMSLYVRENLTNAFTNEKRLYDRVANRL